MVGLIDGFSYNQQLELIYIAYFNRAGDANGYAFWNGQNVQAQGRGQSAPDALKNIANSFTPQPETFALYPFLSSQNVDLTTQANQSALGSVVDAIYLNLFNRVADAPGKAYWVSNITSGAIPLGQAVLFIANGASASDAIVVQNKIAVAADFTTRTTPGYQSFVQPPATYVAAAKSVLASVDGNSLNDSSVASAIKSTTVFLDTAPTISGTVANQQTADTATVKPFSGAAITDPDSGAAETVTISVTANGTASDANGQLTGTGLTHTGAGTYTLTTGSPSATTALLQALVFTPTPNEAAPNASITTGLAVSVSDGIATPATTDSTTTVVATRLDTAPTLAGTVANQPTTDTATVKPFSGVTVTDPDIGAAETVTISVTANGTASDANGLLAGTGLTHLSAGTYTLTSGSPAAVSVLLQGLVFTPTANQAAPNGSITTGFAVAVSDGFATPATTDIKTTVVATRPAPVSTTTSLTLLQDNPPASGAGGDVINAPLAFNAGTGTQITTLQAGDTITETGASNSLNLTVGANDKTISGAVVSGVQTFNVSNLGFTGAPVLAGGGISGLTTVNNVNSTQAVSVGSVASPLASALSTVGVSSTTPGANLTNTTVMEAAAALAGGNDSLTINASNAGTATNTDQVLAGPATGANGYETVTVNATGADFIGIGNPLAGPNTTTKVNVAGSGTISLFGDGLGNDFQSLSTINASGATGAVTITGANTASGLLAGDAALTSITGGSAGDSVDISSMTPAQITANHTAIDLGAGRNTLIVNNATAASSSLSGAKFVQILGDTNPGSTAATTIDLSMLPASIDTFQLFGNPGANPTTLINGPSAFTINQSTFGSGSLNNAINVSAAGAGQSDTLTIVEGTPLLGNQSAQFYNVSGYETINLQAQNGPTQQDTLFQIIGNPSAGGSETLNITGATPVTILGPLTGSAVVLGTTSKIVDADSAVVTLATTGNTGSTDAKIIDASTSGGLIMGGAETGNDKTIGQSITGSGVVGKSNILIGSPGNDALTGGVATDIIATDGGADVINLGTTHTIDRIELFGVDNNKTVQPAPGAAVGPQVASAGSIVNAADQGQAGFWGVVPGGGAAPISIFSISNSGTSADMATVSHFIGGITGDIVDISLSSFTAATGLHKGLTAVDGKTAAVSMPGSGSDVQIVQAQSGSLLAGSTSDFVELTTGSFASAAQLAVALKSGSYALSLSAATQAGAINHLLIAYNDTVGNTRIADVAINQAATATGAFSAQTSIVAQDLVQLTGVSVTSLTSNNVHILN